MPLKTITEQDRFSPGLMKHPPKGFVKGHKFSCADYLREAFHHGGWSGYVVTSDHGKYQCRQPMSSATTIGRMGISELPLERALILQQNRVRRELDRPARHRSHIPAHVVILHKALRHDKRRLTPRIPNRKRRIAIGP
jgi:hypothetical protein